MSGCSTEMTNNSAVIVAMLEMSLLGDVFFTQRTFTFLCPQNKDLCLNSVRGTLIPQTCDLSKSSLLADFSGNTTTAITHSTSALTGMCIIPGRLWKVQGWQRERGLFPCSISFISRQPSGNMSQSNNNGGIQCNNAFMWSNHVLSCSAAVS